MSFDWPRSSPCGPEQRSGNVNKTVHQRFHLQNWHFPNQFRYFNGVKHKRTVLCVYTQLFLVLLVGLKFARHWDFRVPLTPDLGLEGLTYTSSYSLIISYGYLPISAKYVSVPISHQWLFIHILVIIIILRLSPMYPRHGARRTLRSL